MSVFDQSLDRVIPITPKSLKEDGYEFVTVGQLIYYENYYIDENGEQHKNNY